MNETYVERQKRHGASRILESNELLIWYSMQRNEVFTIWFIMASPFSSKIPERVHMSTSPFLYSMPFVIYVTILHTYSSHSLSTTSDSIPRCGIEDWRLLTYRIKVHRANSAPLRDDCCWTRSRRAVTCSVGEQEWSGQR